MMQQPQSLLGELVVVALKAENLQHQATSKQDPFCIFRVNEVVKRTKTDYGGGSYPIWDDQVNIPIRQGQHRLHVQIFDKEANARNLMGEGVVDLTKVLREREHDGYFPVKYQGKHGGEIYLELTFYPIQQSMARPQQPVRYQYPPGSNGYRPRPLPPLPQQQQQQQSHGHYAPSHQRPLPHQRPPPPHPVAHAPYSAPPHPSTTMPPCPPPPHMSHYHSTPLPPHSAPPQHSVPPYPPHSMPLPNQHPPYPQPRPSTSSQIMSSSQPLLSSPYHPAASPIPRPIQGSPYPPRPPGPYQPSPMPQARPYPPGQSMRPMPPSNRPNMYPPY